MSTGTAPASELGKIGAPALRALEGLHVTTLSALTAYSASQLLQLHGFGPKALRIIEEQLHARGLSLMPEP